MPVALWLRVGAAAAAAALTAASTLIASPAVAQPANLSGAVVFLDPGHNGSNDGSISRQVTNGRGGTKECQTSGTSTDAGFPEHTFTWDTTLRIRALLGQMGVQTALSRGNDNALGPCVDERAAMANSLRPNAIVSIHADGGPASGRGFHVNYSSPPLNTAQAGPSMQLARTMRDALAGSGIPPATYIGNDGLYGRADLAGLNLAEFPAVLVELGNMKNPADLALINSPEGRQKYAVAVVRGVAAFLGQPGARH